MAFRIQMAFRSPPEILNLEVRNHWSQEAEIRSGGTMHLLHSGKCEFCNLITVHSGRSEFCNLTTVHSGKFSKLLIRCSQEAEICFGGTLHLLAQQAVPFLTNFNISKSRFRHSCSLVRDFQKWFQNENNSKIEVASKRQSFYQVLHKAKISKLSD